MHDFAKVGVEGSNPFARSNFSFDINGTCSMRLCRIRQLLAERTTNSPPEYGENPGTLFTRRSV